MASDSVLRRGRLRRGRLGRPGPDGDAGARRPGRVHRRLILGIPIAIPAPDDGRLHPPRSSIGDRARRGFETEAPRACPPACPMARPSDAESVHPAGIPRGAR
ncbi:MAG: hypothetical protein MZU91_10720 [Desulfosudis oleivorans]|nr:hypothetical protein [Desulfosudis oleivorans]